MHLGDQRQERSHASLFQSLGHDLLVAGARLQPVPVFNFRLNPTAPIACNSSDKLVAIASPSKSHLTSDPKTT
jgi:hypothetical protein